MLKQRLAESVVDPIVLPSSIDPRLPLWLPVVVVLGAILMAAGGIIALVHPAMLVATGEEITSAVRIYAGYLVSRNLALAVMLVVTLSLRARSALSSLMVLTAIIQLLDAGMDVIEGRWVLVPGVLIYAIIFFMGATRISGQVWRAAAWRS